MKTDFNVLQVAQTEQKMIFAKTEQKMTFLPL